MATRKSKIVYHPPIDRIHMFFVFFIIFSISCTRRNLQDESLPYFNEPDLQPSWFEEIGKKSEQIHAIQPFTFLDQTGHFISSDLLKGKMYVANFFFTSCPSICPKMTFNLKKLQDSITGTNDIKIISFSVMPWVDSVARLSAYAKENGIDATYWHLLTGNQKEINFLARNSFFAEKQKKVSGDETSFLHTELMFLIDQHSSIRGVYNATIFDDVKRLLSDINILKSSDQ